MPRALFVSLPLHGHTNPTLPLARALVRSGHHVDYLSVGGVDHGYLLSGGAWVPFDPPGSTRTMPFKINPSGDVVGQYDSAGVTHGFLLRAGVFTTVDVPGATSTVAVGVNPQGEISGRYTSGGVTHGFLLSAGTFTMMTSRAQRLHRLRELILAVTW
jgi:uncharacterized membrane protein